MSVPAATRPLEQIACVTGPAGVVDVVATPTARVDWCVAGVLIANLAHLFLFDRLYPEHRLDPDLLAYITYFRNWVADDHMLHALPYYTGPKALLVFTLGALGNVSAALACSALASALLGAVVYLIARDAFGRPAALATSLFLLLDPSKAFLTLKSSADLYLALLLFLAILLSDRKWLIGAAFCLFLSVLVKPVTLPCALYFLVAPDSRARRWSAALIPFAAAPLILLANHALLGSAFGGSRYFDEFASMAAKEPLGPGELVHYALWSQLIRIRFVSTASWGLVGMLLWIGDDRSRLTRPLVLLPLLFLFGYIALSAALPFPPYFRYFWPLEIWFLMFLVHGVLEGARRLAGTNTWQRRAIAGVVLVLLANGLIERQLDYQRQYATPIEQSMRFASAATDLLHAQRRSGETIVAPLSMLPYLMWDLPEAGRTSSVDTAERIAREQLSVRPAWIIDIPQMYKTDATGRWIQDIARDGAYQVYVTDGQSALLGRRSPDPAGSGR